MKTENILLVLTIIIIILFTFSIFRDFVTPIPIIVQNPPTRLMYGGPRPCPFPFGCGRKSRPGRGGWFPTSLSIRRVGQNKHMRQNKHIRQNKHMRQRQWRRNEKK